MKRNRRMNRRARLFWLALVVVMAMMTSMFSAIAEAGEAEASEPVELEAFELEDYEEEAEEESEASEAPEESAQAEPEAESEPAEAPAEAPVEESEAPVQEGEAPEGQPAETEQPETAPEQGEATETAEPAEDAEATEEPMLAGDDSTIVGFEALSQTTYTLSGKPPYEQVASVAMFPTTLTAILGSGDQKPVEVTWSCDEYDNAEYGAFTFTAVLVSEEETLAEDLKMPTIKFIAMVITKVGTPKKTEFVMGGKPGETAAEAAATLGLPNTLKVTVSGETDEETDLAVNWVCPDYESREVGDFDFTAEFNGTSYRLAEGVTMPEVTLTVISSDDFTFIENADKTLTITGWKGSGSQVEIPAQIGESMVSAIGDEAFKDQTELTRVKLPDGIVTLGDSVFAGCTKLREITFPDSMREIGKSVVDSENTIDTVILLVNDETTLTNNDKFDHVEKVEGEEDKHHVVQLPVEITDIEVENVGKLTIATDYTVIANHGITVGSDAECTIDEGFAVINHGTITVNGKITNNGDVYGCDENSKLVPDNAITNKYHTEHTFNEDGICAYCGAQRPEAQIPLSDSNIVIQPIDDQVYTGNEITPDVTVVYNKTYNLVRGTDYTLSYEDNIEVGTARVTITGIGRFTGTRAGTFKIVEPGTKTDRTVRISIKSGHNPTKVYDKTRNVSLKSSDFSISNVAEGDTVKISKITAAYDTAAAGSRTVNISFQISQVSETYNYKVSDITIDGTITKKPLNITPTADQSKLYGASNPSYYKGKVNGLLTGDTLTGRLSRESGENVGKYKITKGTIDAGDNYEVVVAEEYFTINPKSINATDVGMTAISNQRYTGSRVEPAITLKYGTHTLVKGTDFDVTYSNNIQAGTATATISGKGNYTGTRTAEFRILRVSSGGSSSSSSSTGTTTYYSSSTTDSTEDDTDEGTEETEEEEAMEEELVGVLTIDDESYGTVLFGEDNRPRAFEVNVEVLEPEITEEDVIGESEVEEEAVEEKILYIQPNSMTDPVTGETIYMPEDSTRERYEPMTLRMTPTLVDTLKTQGFVELVYELEYAEVHVPLDDLTSEIDLTPFLKTEEDTAYVAEEEWTESAETELPETADGEMPNAEDDSAWNTVDETGELEVAPPMITVDNYVITVHQLSEDTMSERENVAMEDLVNVIPMYRVDVSAVQGELEVASDDDTEAATGTTLAADKPVPVYYPMLGVLKDVDLRVVPLEDLAELPEETQKLFISDDMQLLDEDAVELEALDREADILTDEVFDYEYVHFTPEHSGTYTLVTEIPEEEAEADEAAETAAATETAAAPAPAAPTATPEPELLDDPDSTYAYSRRSNDGNQYWLVDTVNKTVEYYREDNNTYMIGDYEGSLISGMTVKFRQPAKTVNIKLKFQQTYKFALMEDGDTELLMEEDDYDTVNAAVQPHR